MPKEQGIYLTAFHLHWNYVEKTSDFFVKFHNEVLILSGIENITFALTSIQKILKELEMKSSTYASIVATSDGMPVTSAAHNYVNEVEASGVASSILALGEQTTETFKHEGLKRVLISAEEGTSILTQINSNLILLCVAPKKARLGLLFIEINKAIGKINEAIVSTS